MTTAMNCKPAELKTEPMILSIERSAAGRRGIRFPRPEKHAGAYLPERFLRKTPPRLPELSEFETVRHYTGLSRRNYCLDTHFYPLGSCTMKYNPRVNEDMAALPGFANVHPYAPEAAMQGTLGFYYGMEQLLCEITGLGAFTLAPAAGAHGEFTGILVAAAYHRSRKDRARTEIVVADSSHGTNPASAAMGGFSVVTVKSKPNGRVDLGALKAALGPKTAMVMLTVPNTVGLFESEILEISRSAHDAGALFYMDGANFNAVMGIAKPAQFGVDIMHLNLHKSFSTPHGGGGPGSGPVGVVRELEKFLPVPRVVCENGAYKIKTGRPGSIGRVRSFLGNTGVVLKGYCYLRMHDGGTLRSIAENSIINANYVRVKLKDLFPCAYDEHCMHECVLTTVPERLNGIKTLDVAKRLLDYGFYAPTIYFPLIVHEALMIEPTETETRETLDAFIGAMRAIAAEALADPALVKNAPEGLPVNRLDEVGAARNPDVRWR
ncbi:MAG: aminomethyl-transferring glycine dehydrogenase subunit GcvPB [Elusimicrobiaceae bacterium]|nr:aminomethyl-transferring glycine dehydrogenase subunit GcvPB [Elusimicrobiaceae bacterium]